MIDIYGLNETARTWRQKAAALAADVVARHATDVDTNARFPTESMTVLAQGGFYGLCTDVNFGGQGQGPATFATVVAVHSKPSQYGLRGQCHFFLGSSAGLM
jgi:alkylation response protein AidB-like acyl-CoA dehydrogenase